MKHSIPETDFDKSEPTFDTLRPRRNEQHFVDDIFKRIFFIENVWISIKISLKFVPKGPINNIPALVQIMAWCRSGDKPLSEPMMVSLPTHICVTRPRWVKAVQGKACLKVLEQLWWKSGEVYYSLYWEISVSWLPHCDLATWRFWPKDTQHTFANTMGLQCKDWFKYGSPYIQIKRDDYSLPS